MVGPVFPQLQLRWCSAANGRDVRRPVIALAIKTAGTASRKRSPLHTFAGKFGSIPPLNFDPPVRTGVDLMRRRELITLLGGAVANWPLAARAQQSGKIWRIGFIAHRYEIFYGALFEGLRELGYAEGQNLIVERRYAEGRVERFKEFAAEMVRLKVDLIIVVTTPA